MHKFGLATQKDLKDKPPRKFSLRIDRNVEIVGLPIKDWNGNFSDKSEDTITTIYIIDLIDKIEEVYQKIQQENTNDNLDLVIGIDEIKTRFTILS